MTWRFVLFSIVLSVGLLVGLCNYLRSRVFDRALYKINHFFQVKDNTSKVPSRALLSTLSLLVAEPFLFMFEVLIHVWSTYSCLKYLFMFEVLIHVWSTYSCLMYSFMFDVLIHVWSTFLWRHRNDIYIYCINLSDSLLGSLEYVLSIRNALV